MKIGELEIPKALLDSHKNDKLVVFAGAGISVPSPSALPNFLELARTIAEGSSYSLAKRDEGTLDRFLGDLERKGVKVRELTKRILTKPTSKPAKWHEYILKLFAESNLPVRIVTTNFDAHFCSEAQNQALECSRYFAPALPLGDSFEGIVYLHGHVERDLSTVVITDEDFGRAYLTRAWATKFLQDMFSSYAVLFVGYSHNDPLMHYLARGLNYRTSAPRFILTDDADDTKWKNFEITPIGYRQGQHSVAMECFGKWLDFLRRGAVDHERDIGRICSALPPKTKEETDYLEHVLQSDVLRPIFVEKTKSIEWVDWVENHGFLDELFEPLAIPRLSHLNYGALFDG